MSLIEVNNVLKRYGHNVAVDNIHLEINAGEIFGLLGPNGAGKSTTISILCGLLKFDQGEVIIDGFSLKNNPIEVKKRIGLVPQEIAIFEQLTAKENVEFFGKLAGLRGKLLKERVDDALSFVGLQDKGEHLPKNFSGGMKRRLNIACAIVHQPKIIIMDEPTVGIDPQSRNHILESVKILNELGSTIIYTSHYMEEVESICTRIAIMDHGKLIAKGNKEELKQLITSNEKITIELTDYSYISIQDIKSLAGVKDARIVDSNLEINVTKAQSVLQDILFILQKNDIKIRGMKLSEADLESVFLSLTGRQLRD